VFKKVGPGGYSPGAFDGLVQEQAYLFVFQQHFTGGPGQYPGADID
jgi:hypothetical protein